MALSLCAQYRSKLDATLTELFGQQQWSNWGQYVLLNKAQQAASEHSCDDIERMTEDLRRCRSFFASVQKLCGDKVPGARFSTSEIVLRGLGVGPKYGEVESVRDAEDEVMESTTEAPALCGPAEIHGSSVPATPLTSALTLFHDALFADLEKINRVWQGIRAATDKKQILTIVAQVRYMVAELKASFNSQTISDETMSKTALQWPELIQAKKHLIMMGIMHTSPGSFELGSTFITSLTLPKDFVPMIQDLSYTVCQRNARDLVNDPSCVLYMHTTQMLHMPDVPPALMELLEHTVLQVSEYAANPDDLGSIACMTTLGNTKIPGDTFVIACAILSVRANYYNLMCERIGNPEITMICNMYWEDELHQSHLACSSFEQFCKDNATLLYWDKEVPDKEVPLSSAHRDNFQKWVVGEKANADARNARIFDSRRKQVMEPVTSILALKTAADDDFQQVLQRLEDLCHYVESLDFIFKLQEKEGTIFSIEQVIELLKPPQP